MTNEKIIQDAAYALKEKKTVFTREVRKGFHEVLTEIFKPDVSINSSFGEIRLKTRPASPNLVTIIYLNGHRVYKILHEGLVGKHKEIIDAFLNERLQRPSYDEQLTKVLTHAEMNNFRQSF